MARGKSYDDEGNSALQRKTIWQVCPHWYQEGHTFYADCHPERFHEDQRGAWADFHWCWEHGRKPGREQFTVDLLKEDLIRTPEGWKREGMLEMIDRQPDGVPKNFNDPEVAEARRQGMLEVREALANAKAVMGRRHELISAPLTIAEYAEAKAESWDTFGDPGPPEDT